MNVTRSHIPGLLVLDPDVFSDDRGNFFESFNEKRFCEIGINEVFVQDNHSFSLRGVLRGLHYQIRRPQGKLVRVVWGEVFDVAVDLRRSSKTFGQCACVVLSSENKKVAWIPPGFAHGFLVTSDSAVFIYKATDYYAPECERTLAWNDPSLAIPWPWVGEPVLSAKDRAGAFLGSAEVFA